MSKKKLLVLVLALCFFSTLTFAQNNESSLSVGVVSRSQTLTSGPLPITCPVTLPNCNIIQ